MIKSRIEINGKSIAVCKVSKKETILTLLEEQVGRSKGRKPRGPYHAHSPKTKNEEDKNSRLTYLLYSLIVSKQQFEAALLKARIKLEDLKRYLKRKGD